MIATQFSSLSFLSNWRTKLTYFFITPLINMMLLVLIDMQYAGSFDWGVAITSITIDAASLSMQTINLLIVNDSDLRIDFELIAKNPFSLRYWLSKALVSLFIGALLALINFCLIFVLGAPLEVIGRALLVLPLVGIYGIILGFCSWAVSWQMNDPYFLQNIFGGLIQILSGVLVVISAYPAWLKTIAMLFPFAGPVAYIKTGSANLLVGIFLSLVWLIIGLIAYLIQIKPVLRKGKHRF